MSPLKWILLICGAAVILVYTVWWYRTREEPVAGLAPAAALRAAALLLAWLILLNPAIPVTGQEVSGGVVAFLDASFSMTRPGAPDGPSVWSAALDSVARFEQVWLFGGSTPRYVSSDSLPAAPLYPESRLAPALRAAASAGARQTLVFSDARIADAAGSLEVARRQGISFSVVRMGSSFPEAGIAALTATPWAEVGDTAEVGVELLAAALEGGVVRLEVVDDGGRVRATGWATLPEAGRYTPLRLRFPVRGPTGYQRYTVRLTLDSPDPEPRDDRRVFYIRVTERPAGPVLISLRPDWEPSFLLPNLDRLSDAPATAYLSIAEGLVSSDDYRAVPLSTVQRRVRGAPLLVLHGYGAEAPSWAQTLADHAERLLVMSAGTRAFELPGWGIRVGAPAPGEWYAASDPPPSPMALDLAAVSVDELSPLLRVRAVEGRRTWVALSVRRFRRGEPLPAIVAGSAGARRWAVATAEGYWRWASRPGAGRQLYRALWTGVAGWLLDGRSDGAVGVEPRQRVVENGEPLQWRAPERVDSLVVELSASDSGLLWRGVAAAADSLVTAAPPGRYRYVARGYREGRVAASAQGPVEVEEFSRELLPGAAVAESLTAVTPAPVQRSADGSRRLANSGWPYLILIALFCGEWAVRRRRGLR
ncbi:MAG: hypothetical protein AMS25_08660 [Gemmatimonas sp. SM23_52]|nr:MAG: hypothetical protein AMS25_08660 [Gemmatimonas sp. SM23_52]